MNYRAVITQALFAVLALILGCSKSLSSVEDVFGTDQPISQPAIPVKSISFTGQTKGDFTVFQNGAKIHVGKNSIGIKLPLGKTLIIPSTDVFGCTMVCFGGEKWNVDLLIPKIGTNISFEHSKDVYEWCWDNKLPMVSGDVTRKWLYLKAPLPAKESFHQVLASRAAYDKQAKLACNGY